jgi:pimeloyl-ACP methyl ester carboxylesterase
MSRPAAIRTAQALGFASALVDVGLVRLHCVRHGGGTPLLLLHGWPELWLVWRKVMKLLDPDHALIVPDLRGFGASRQPGTAPSDEAGPEVHAGDLLALLDRLGVERVGLVAHDVGSSVAQALARRAPERVLGLFFFDCFYPGIGRRWLEPAQIPEIWYQSFHQLPWAAASVGSSRAACGLHIGHFLRHWSADPHAFDSDLEIWIDNFMEPGNLQGGFDWYRSVAGLRRQMMEGTLPAAPPIGIPTRVLWGRHDPILRAEWMDRLPEAFTDLRTSVAEDAGHFVHWERPALAADEIRAFFAGLS